MVSEDQEDEENSQADGRHREEVNRDQVAHVVGEERAPGLGWRSAPLRHQPGHRAFRDGDSQLQELTMDSRCSPQRIRVGHPGDERGDFGARPRPAHRARCREVGPVVGESTALPSQDGVGTHEHEGVAPSTPELREGAPEEAIGRPESRPLDSALVHRELLAQGNVLKRQVSVATAEEREEPQEVQECGGHETVIVAEGLPKHQLFQDVRILANDRMPILSTSSTAEASAAAESHPSLRVTPAPATRRNGSSGMRHCGRRA
jgi:hypothetical protein